MEIDIQSGERRMDGYLTKPIRAETRLSAIATALQQASAMSIEHILYTFSEDGFIFSVFFKIWR